MRLCLNCGLPWHSDSCLFAQRREISALRARIEVLEEALRGVTPGVDQRTRDEPSVTPVTRSPNAARQARFRAKRKAKA